MEGRMFARWANSPSKESITENTNKKAKDFDDSYGGRFSLHRNQRPTGIQPLKQFNHMRVDKKDGFSGWFG